MFVVRQKGHNAYLYTALMSEGGVISVGLDEVVGGYLSGRA